MNDSATVHPTPRPTSPSTALQALYDGNARFMRGETDPDHRDLSRLKAVASEQKPFAAFLGCADSRVPIEIIFDQGFGDVFVTRIAGNVADPAIIGSLEFATELLDAQVIYVLGHSRCGAVSATIDGGEAPGQISVLFEHIRQAAVDAHGDLANAIVRNVQLQAQMLVATSPAIRRRLLDGSVIVAGGVYDLDTGRVVPVTLDPVAFPLG